MPTMTAPMLAGIVSNPNVNKMVGTVMLKMPITTPALRVAGSILGRRPIRARAAITIRAPPTCLRGKMVKGLTPFNRTALVAAGALPQVSEAMAIGIQGLWVIPCHRVPPAVP